MYEELIRVQGTAARIACARVTARQLAVIEDAVQRAARLPPKTDLDRRVTAYGQVHLLLAVAAGDSVVASVLSTGPEYLRDLMSGAGAAAAGLVETSHRRLVAHLRAGDADAAAAELGNLLRGLHAMRGGNRTAWGSSPAAA